MKSFPKISIVTPNYNGAEFLEETIKSVVNQNYPNLEYIIIDGGSNDNSIDIIKKYESQIAYWVSEPDKGLYHAIQKGFDRSTGEIMAWINSDDMYRPGSFDIVAEIFSNFNQVNWLMGLPSIYDGKGRTIYVDNFKQWSKFDFYTNNYKWVQQESVFWRRCLWERSGENIDYGYKFAGDLNLWVRFFRFEKLYCTTALLSGFRARGSGQLSIDFLTEYEEEVQKILEAEKNSYLSKDEENLVQNFVRIKSRAANSHYLIRFILNYYFKSLKKKYFDYPQPIRFDRKNQKFVI